MVKRELKLHLYIMSSDSGFAPHVTDNLLTLATCKPKIRRMALVGDYLLGIAGKELSKKCGKTPYRLIYLAKITDKKTFDQYSTDSKYTDRRENIYFRNSETREWNQKTNNSHGRKQKDTDLKGCYSLLSDYFIYRGRHCEQLDDEKFSEVLRLLRRAPRADHKPKDLSSNPNVMNLIDSIFSEYKDEMNKYQEPIESKESLHVSCRKY
ncbi:MAG: hypothetical protein ACREAN_03260 [Nitrosopumilaceae archaeon]